MHNITDINLRKKNLHKYTYNHTCMHTYICTWGHWPIKWENKRNMTKTLLYPLRNIDTQKPHFCTQGMPLSSIFTEFSTKNHFFIEKNLTPPVPNPMLMYNFTFIITFSLDQNVCSWKLITDRNRKLLGWLEQKSVDL